MKNLIVYYSYTGNTKKVAEEIAKKEKCVRVEFCCWSFNKHANEIYNHLGFKEQRVIFEKEI